MTTPRWGWLLGVMILESGRGKGTSLTSTCLTPKPLASSIYVHVPEAPSPHERSMSVTSLFPSRMAVFSPPSFSAKSALPEQTAQRAVADGCAASIRATAASRMASSASLMAAAARSIAAAAYASARAARAFNLCVSRFAFHSLTASTVVRSLQVQLEIQKAQEVAQADHANETIPRGDQEASHTVSLHLAQGIQGVGIR